MQSVGGNALAECLNRASQLGQFAAEPFRIHRIHADSPQRHCEAPLAPTAAAAAEATEGGLAFVRSNSRLPLIAL